MQALKSEKSKLRKSKTIIKGYCIRCTEVVTFDYDEKFDSIHTEPKCPAPCGGTLLFGKPIEAEE